MQPQVPTALQSLSKDGQIWGLSLCLLSVPGTYYHADLDAYSWSSLFFLPALFDSEHKSEGDPQNTAEVDKDWAVMELFRKKTLCYYNT